MRIFRVNNGTGFTGVRQDRNTVSQLKQDNDYDLNLPNRRKISQAIEDLSNVPGEDNVEFLLDVSENLRYGTNIDLGKKSYNDWRTKLNQAAEKSLKLSDKSVQEKLAQRLSQAMMPKKEYTDEEKNILAQRELLISRIDEKEVKNIANPNSRNLHKNLNYFIVSSEVPTKQKIYILKRLNYFMSDDYKINPQLADKKTRVLAEILNDIVVDTPESKIPNIKAVNQRQHGMCVAISICRKALAYEDKANYVDMVMTELDDSEYMQVYDRSRLGEKKKLPVPKANIDYNYAIEKGYRIVDTSVMNWMNAADTVGAFNDVVGAYNAFDKENFGTFTDTHFHRDIDKESENKQDYYRSCQKAKEALTSVKKDFERQKYFTSIKPAEDKHKIESTHANIQVMQAIIREIDPNADKETVRKITNDLLSLQVKDSDAKEKTDKKLYDYTYIANEEDESKAEKIKNYLNNSLPASKNNKILNEKASELVDLTKEIKELGKTHKPDAFDSYQSKIKLYNAAAAYRTENSYMLDIPDHLHSMMIEFKIPDEESLLVNNLRDLSQKLKKGKISPELREGLIENFSSELEQHAAESKDGIKDVDKALADIFDEYAKTTEMLMTQMLDDFYNSILIDGRKQSLITQLDALKLAVTMETDKRVLQSAADELGVKANKRTIIETIDNYTNELNDPNCTDEKYIEVFNNTGHKSQLLDIRDLFDSTGRMMFEEGNTDYIRGFNLVNGAPADVDIETTKELYTVLAKSFNNMSVFIKTLQLSLLVKDKDGHIINSADPKFAIMKKLEKMGEIGTEKELEALRDKFDAYYRLRYSDDGTKRDFKDLPKPVTTFTPFEKEALKKYDKNINSWYSTSVRRLNDIYNDMKEPLEELNRDIGVKKGEYWVHENDSGLMGNQAVKIFEHMTDRPYYEEKNIKSGVEKIKNSHYSASSMSSVKDDYPAMHGQYVADIRPEEIKTKEGTEIKDIIMHDNTWGAAEHKNVWTDSNGFVRTDYSNGYGGELGYITNDQYMNGKIADNIVDKQGKFVPNDIPSKQYKKLNMADSEEYIYPMLRSFIIQGTSPQAISTVKEIKDNLLLPSSEYLDNLTEEAEKMTQAEIKSAIQKIKTAGRTSSPVYNKMLKDIKGDDSPFNKGIETLEDYKKIPENDKLRLILDKVAIIKSYDSIPDLKTYHIEVKSQKDITYLRNKLNKVARDNFDYALAKNPDIFKYAADNSRQGIYKELKQFESDNDIKLSHDKMVKSVNSMKRIKTSEFDGSLTHSIDLMEKHFIEAVKKYTKDGNIPEEKYEKLGKDIRKILEEKTAISANDIKQSFNTGRLAYLAQWADRVFEPKTDEELAQILTDLRNMTTKEFKERYDATITPVDMGIKQIDGYDIVKMIRGGNSSMRNALVNTVFSEQYYKDIDMSKMTPYYDCTKFSRKLTGGHYVGKKRSFDDIYSDYYYNFEVLGIKKIFNQMKDEAFRKYSAFPAYPLIEISTKDSVNQSLNKFYDQVSNYILSTYAYKTQEASLETITALKKYSDKHLSQREEISYSQYLKVKKELNELFELNKNDETYTKEIKKAQDLLESDSRSSKEYAEVIDSLYKFIKIYEKTGDDQTMREAIGVTLLNIDTYKNTYIRNMFEPKYQGKAFEILNRWITARSKELDNHAEDNSTSDAIYAQFRDLFMKHRLLETPEKMLDEYLLLCAKDAKAPDTKLNSKNSELAQKDLEEMKSTYKNHVSQLLFKSDMMELQYTLMDCAKAGNLNAVRDAFKNSTIELKNGTVVPMDSEEGMRILVSAMLGEKNLDTAALFLNQLGLSEKIAEIIAKDSTMDEAYKNFARIQSILKSAEAQAKFIKTEYMNIKDDIDNSPNWEEIVNKFKEDVINKARHTNYRGTVELYDAMFHDFFIDVKNQPNASKSILLASNIQTAINGIREIISENVKYLNEPLNIIQVRYDLIRKLQFPETSKSIALAENYIKELQKLLDYENSQQSNFPYLGMHQA